VSEKVYLQHDEAGFALCLDGKGDALMVLNDVPREVVAYRRLRRLAMQDMIIGTSKRYVRVFCIWTLEHARGQETVHIRHPNNRWEDESA
jgi:hypothetical protein